MKKWKYEDIMSFMVPIFAERNQKSNLPADPSQDLLDETSIDTDNIGLSNTENTLTSPTSVSSPQPDSSPSVASQPFSPSTHSHNFATNKKQKQTPLAVSHVLRNI